MSDAQLRQRQQRLEKEATEKGSHAQRPPARSESSGFGTALTILAFVVLGLSVYFYPDAYSRALDLFIGFDSSDISQTTQKTPSGDFRIVADDAKKQAVKDAFQYAWNAYERDALGDDEYHPIGKSGSNLTEAGGIGYFVVDCLDTMLVMGLKDEYSRARTWVQKSIDFDRDGNFNTFETTIRVLGGLLAAYHLSGQDQLYLTKAKELADRMLPAFDTATGLPLPMVNLAKRKGVPDEYNSVVVSTAEAATLQLEFKYLSYLTDDETYWERSEHVMSVIKQAMMPHGLASIYMNVDQGQFIMSEIRLGSRGDSYYEYLLKQYLQTSKVEDVYRDMYENAMDGIHEHLVKRTLNGVLYTAELLPQGIDQGTGEMSWQLSPKQDHLVCFLAGSLMLGATTTGHQGIASVPPKTSQFSAAGLRDWNTGKELLDTCVKTYDTATGLSPEIVHFRIQGDNLDHIPDMPLDWYIKGARPGAPAPYDARYMLRPETVESLFIAYRLTGDEKYREAGWRIFQSIEKHAKIPTGGYATVLNVAQVPPEMLDKMETFLMSETLKYLYLLFEDAEVLPLDQHVFNTEAHPLPVFKSTLKTGFS